MEVIGNITEETIGTLHSILPSSDDLDEVEEFIDMFFGKGYPNVKYPYFWVRLNRLLHLRHMFPKMELCLIALTQKDFNLDEYIDKISRIENVVIEAFPKQPHHVDVGWRYENVKKFSVPVEVESIYRVQQCFPSITEIHIWGKSSEVPWDLLDRYESILLYTPEDRAYCPDKRVTIIKTSD